MRRLLGLLLILAASLSAADVTGKWKGKVVTDDGYLPILLFLKQDGASLKGSGGPDGLNQSPVENGKITGGRLTFDLTPPGHSPLHFELTLSGEELTGTSTVKHNGKVVISTVTVYRPSN